ncbi:6861_t:CDS:2 [Paraglomus occultum]|uniref:6861_t:CDS:1 n=1 Tax=Paraglomus occultum TaxID=144539 RepID=A0A9N9BBA0_9GLOM|nr:6861_t:CDS:2 [Paraglomus occultum]
MVNIKEDEPRIEEQSILGWQYISCKKQSAAGRCVVLKRFGMRRSAKCASESNDDGLMNERLQTRGNESGAESSD